MKTEAPPNILRVSGIGSLQGILQSKNIELIKLVQELELENNRLRKAIEGWGKLEFCDCWKKDALG